MARVASGPLGPMVARAPVRSMTFAGVPFGLKLELFASPAARGAPLRVSVRIRNFIQGGGLVTDRRPSRSPGREARNPTSLGASVGLACSLGGNQG